VSAQIFISEKGTHDSTAYFMSQPQFHIWNPTLLCALNQSARYSSFCGHARDQIILWVFLLLFHFSCYHFQKPMSVISLHKSTNWGTFQCQDLLNTLISESLWTILLTVQRAAVSHFLGDDGRQPLLSISWRCHHLAPKWWAFLPSLHLPVIFVECFCESYKNCI